VRLAKQRFVIPDGHIALKLQDEAFEDDFGNGDWDAAAEYDLRRQA
jgi:hypothetical protein